MLKGHIIDFKKDIIFRFSDVDSVPACSLGGGGGSGHANVECVRFAVLCFIVTVG